MDLAPAWELGRSLRSTFDIKQELFGQLSSIESMFRYFLPIRSKLERLLSFVSKTNFESQKFEHSIASAFVGNRVGLWESQSALAPFMRDAKLPHRPHHRADDPAYLIEA